MQLLDGVLVSETIKNELRLELNEWKSCGGKTPHLATILVGNDASSIVYVNHKMKACKELGFDFSLFKLTTEEELTETIKTLNTDSNIDGILVQLPLPFNTNILNTINPLKDVDCLTMISLGKLF